MEEITDENEVTSKCRICMRIAKPLYHLLSEVNQGAEKLAFNELIKRVCNLQISLSINAPVGVCTDCMEQLVKTYNFLQIIRDAEQHWLQLDKTKNNPLQSVNAEIYHDDDEILHNFVDLEQRLDIIDLTQCAAVEQAIHQVSPVVKNAMQCVGDIKDATNNDELVYSIEGFQCETNNIEQLEEQEGNINDDDETVEELQYEIVIERINDESVKDSASDMVMEESNNDDSAYQFDSEQEDESATDLQCDNIDEATSVEPEEKELLFDAANILQDLQIDVDSENLLVNAAENENDNTSSLTPFAVAHNEMFNSTASFDDAMIMDDESFDLYAIIEEDYSCEDTVDATVLNANADTQQQQQQLQFEAGAPLSASPATVVSPTALAVTKTSKRKIKSTLDEADVMLHCEYCNKKAKAGNYEFHLLVYHNDIYKQKIAAAKTANSFYTCQHCTMDFLNTVCFHAHLVKDHRLKEDEITYVCPHCNCEFELDKQLLAHLKTCNEVQTEEELPKPNLASEQSNNASTADQPSTSLIEHRFVNMLETSNDSFNYVADAFPNEQCASSASDVSDNGEHTVATAQNNNNDDDDSSDYWAPYWSENEREAANKSEMKPQKIVQFKNPESFVCTDCSEVFTTKYGLKYHLQRFHRAVQGTYACMHCPRVFPFKYRLEPHLRLFHKDFSLSRENTDFAKINRRYLCQYCGLMIRRIKDHIWRHQGYKPFKCQVCGFGFVEKTTLDEHMRIHTGEKPYKCEVCGRCFRKGALLIRHMTKHDDSREKMYKCKLCEKSYKSAEALRNHFRFHHTDERKVCNVCNQTFANSTSLYKHRIRFGHEKPAASANSNKKDYYAKIRVGNNKIRWKP